MPVHSKKPTLVTARPAAETALMTITKSNQSTPITSTMIQKVLQKIIGA